MHGMFVARGRRRQQNNSIVTTKSHGKMTETVMHLNCVHCGSPVAYSGTLPSR